MNPVMRRLRAAAVLGLCVGAFWVGFCVLYFLVFAAWQAHPARILSVLFSRMLPGAVGVSLTLGLVFAGGLYLWRPREEGSRLSARRAGLIGAVSSMVGLFALQVTVLGGWPGTAWGGFLVTLGAMSGIGAVVGVALQRIAYHRTLIAGESEARALTP